MIELPIFTLLGRINWIRGCIDYFRKQAKCLYGHAMFLGNGCFLLLLLYNAHHTSEIFFWVIYDFPTIVIIYSLHNVSAVSKLCEKCSSRLRLSTIKLS